MGKEPKYTFFQRKYSNGQIYHVNGLGDSLLFKCEMPTIYLQIQGNSNHNHHKLFKYLQHGFKLFREWQSN